MSDATTYLIVPALTDQAGQCRIVRRAHDSRHRPGLADYRREPGLWAEAGMMGSDGHLVCLDGPAGHFREIRECEPLAAGQVFLFRPGLISVPGNEIRVGDELQDLWFMEGGPGQVKALWPYDGPLLKDLGAGTQIACFTGASLDMTLAAKSNYLIRRMDHP